MKRPFVTVALLYGSGLLLAEAFQPPLRILFPTALGAALSGVALPRLRSWLLPLVLVLAGWTSQLAHTAIVSPHDLRITQGTNAAIVTLRGTLVDTPSQRVLVRDEKESVRTLALIELRHRVSSDSGEAPAFGRVLVTTPGILAPTFFGGQAVEVTGVLAPPPLKEAEGLFDYRAYLRRQEIYYQLKAESPNDWRQVSRRARAPLSDRFQAWAQRMLAQGLPTEDEPLQLLRAMTLGSKAVLPNEVYEPFMKSGTMHIFAISGLHIALICAILVSLLRVARVSRTWCGLLVVPLIWFYTGATGWQPSAIRSAVMMTVVIGGWSLHRPTDLLNSLAAAAFVILVWDPQQLFGASFQLSFFVVLSLALLLPPIRAALDHLFEPDPLLPKELVPRWKRRLHVPLRWLGASAATSVAAWLGSIPLTAYYFHLFSPMTVLANIVVVPLSSLALAANLGSLICGSWLPWAGELFNHSAWFWMTAMVKVSRSYEFLPFAYRYVRAPGLLDFLVYYALLIGLLSGRLLAKERRGWAIGAVACALALGGWHWVDKRAETLSLIPAGGGMTMYANAPGFGGEFLIDCGTTNVFRYITKPFLQAQGVNRLSTLVMTHGDLHHIGGAQLLGTTFHPGSVYASPIRSRSPSYRKAIDGFGEIPGLLHNAARGDPLGRWTVLHPAADEKFPRADDVAMVLMATVHGTRLLLLSDLGRSGQEALMERSPDLRADIVIAGLPSAPEAICDGLLAQLHPRLVIVADTEFPSGERASGTLRQRLANRGFPVVYTRYTGAATLEFRAGGWRLRTLSGMRLDSTQLATGSPSTAGR